MEGRVLKTVVLVRSVEEAEALIDSLKNLNLENNTSLDLKVETNFEAFIGYIQTNLVDLFFLDLNYTHFSIIKLAGHFRASNKYKKTPVILIADKKNNEHELNHHFYAPLIIDQVITWGQRPVEMSGELNTTLKRHFTKVIPENYNVLVVDDNPDIIYLMSSYLNELKHQKFKTCGSLNEAQKLIEKEDFDLLLLDWNLSDGTCIDLINFIRSRKENVRLTNALIMAVTARNDVDDIMTLMKFNVKDYIIKPFGYDEFEEKLIYALEKHNKVSV